MMCLLTCTSELQIPIFSQNLVKVRPPWFHFMESLRNTASLKKFEFLCPFNKALRKLKKSCFASNQPYIELKTKSSFTTTSNFCLSNSSVDNKSYLSWYLEDGALAVIPLNSINTSWCLLCINKHNMARANQKSYTRWLDKFIKRK